MYLYFNHLKCAVWQQMLSGVKNTVLYYNDIGSDPRFVNGPGWYHGGPHGFEPVLGTESVESVKLRCRSMFLQHAVADMSIDEMNRGHVSHSRVSIEACLFSCTVPVMREASDPSDNAGLKWSLHDAFFSDLPRFGKYIHGGESLFPIDTYLLDQQGESRYREIVDAGRSAVFAANGRVPSRSALRLSACFDGTWLCVRPLPYREPFNSLCDIEKFLRKHVYDFAVDNYDRVDWVAKSCNRCADKAAKIRLWSGKL